MRISSMQLQTGAVKSGQTMTEYALILAVVAVVAVVVYITLGSTIANVLTTVIGSL